MAAGPSSRCDNGSFEVRSQRAPDRCTHGPDPAPHDAREGRTVAEMQATAPGPATAQSVQCIGDGTSGNRVQAIYAVPADRPDRYDAIAPLIRQWASAIDDVYYESARETGGGRRVRFVTEPDPNGGCRIKVDKLNMSTTADDSFGNTIDAAWAAGFDDFQRVYLMWTDTTSAHGANICGIGQLWGDDSPGSTNAHNGGVSTFNTPLMSRIDEGCWGLASQSVEAHELTHNLGGVQQSAPNKTANYHCTDEWDIMCYVDAAGVIMRDVCTNASHDNRLDCNNDDYFHTNPAPGSYLATHWNVARNNFLIDAGLTHQESTVLTTTDGDEVIEPGEEFSFSERLVNGTGSVVTGVSAVAEATSAGAQITSPARTYPDLPNAGSGISTEPFTGTLDVSAACGLPIALDLTVTSSAGTHSLPISLPTGTLVSGGGTTTPGTAFGSTASIIEVPLDLTGDGVVTDLDVRVDITHTWVADVNATLVAPDGTEVLLFNGIGGSGHHFIGTVLDDEATDSIEIASAPFTGSWRPESALSAFDGKTIAGTWKLRIEDTFPDADDGVLNSFGVDTKSSECDVEVETLDPVTGGDSQGSVRGDFNNDGLGDIAVGVPGEDVGTVEDAGLVHVLLGGSAGLTATGSQVWTQSSPGVSDTIEPGDRFGNSLAVGDVNGDNYSDLVIGAPGEDVGAVVDAGVVQILYGGPDGLTSAGQQYFSQSSAGVPDLVETGDGFGDAVAVADSNGDGFGDVVIGVPQEDTASGVDSGVLQVLRGGAGGLSSAGQQFLWQNSSGLSDTAEPGDRFGGVLAAGNFDGDAYQDLAIGVPRESVGSVANAGVVHVLPGSATGFSTGADQYWHQNRAGMGEVVEAGDGFGSALATGDLDGDESDDLAVGIPFENETGAVQVLYSMATGLSSDGDQFWTQSSAGIAEDAEAGDRFGAALAIGDIDADSYGDLAVGVPNEQIGTVVGAGAVNVILGDIVGLTNAGDQFWSQNSSGVSDVAEAGDAFGSGLVAGRIDSDAYADLVVATPLESVGPVAGAGVVQLLRGSSSALVSAGNQLWSQYSTGILDGPEPGDGFGSALGR